MRVLAALMLFVAAVMLLLVGGALVLSSRNIQFKARAEAGDLSEVAGDLASTEELQAMERDGAQKAGAAGRPQLVLGILTLLAAPFLVAAGVGVLLRRARMLLPVSGLLALAALAGFIVMEGFSVTAAIAGGLVAASLLLRLYPGARSPRVSGAEG